MVMGLPAMAMAVIAAVVGVVPQVHAAPPGCWMEGCDSSHSYDARLPAPMPQSPNTTLSMLFLNTSFVAFGDDDGGAAGCAFDSHGAIVCIGPRTQPDGTPQNSVVSFTSDGTGKLLYGNADISSNSVPLLTPIGDAVAFDTRAVIGWSSSGRQSLSDPLYAEEGSRVWSLAAGSAGAMSFMVLTFAQGSFATFLENGTPIAGDWMNDTFAGQKGSWAPFGSPVTQQRRWYLLTRWRPASTASDASASKSEFESASAPFTNNIRLWAIEVHQSISNRTVFVWHMDLFDQSFETTEQMAADFSSTLVLTTEGPIVLLSAAASADQPNGVMAILDQGTTAAVLYTLPNTNGVPMNTSFAIDPRPSAEGHPTVWTISSDSSELMRFDAVTGAIVDHRTLSHLIQSYKRRTYVGAAADKQSHNHRTSAEDTTIVSKLIVARTPDTAADPVLLFVIRDVSEPGLQAIAFDVNNVQILWLVSLPTSVTSFRGQVAVGLFGTQHYALVLATSAGIVAYA